MMVNPIRAKSAYNINIRLNFRSEVELGKNSNRKKLSKKNSESFSQSWSNLFAVLLEEIFLEKQMKVSLTFNAQTSANLLFKLKDLRIQEQGRLRF